MTFQKPLSIIYLDNATHNFWKLGDTNLAFENPAADTVIVYPGHNDVGNSFNPAIPRNLRVIE